MIWGEAHPNNVSMDINDVIQGVKKLVRTPLFAKDGPAGRHLVGFDPLNT